jgi:hypothetical protein
MHGDARHRGLGRVRDTLVEHHRDIGSELGLNVSRLLGRQQMPRPVEVGPELHAFVRHGPALGEAEHLVAAAVRKNRLLPPDKPMETAAARDEVIAGP